MSSGRQREGVGGGDTDSSSSHCTASPGSTSKESSTYLDLNNFMNVLRVAPASGNAQQTFQFGAEGGLRPFLRIIEEPQNNFRFRYRSEMVGTHGCLVGANTKSRNKTHPGVELKNYTEEARIRCRLAQCDNDDDHPHLLQNDEQEEQREVIGVVGPNRYQLFFPGMGIIHTAKKNVAEELYKKNLLPNMGLSKQKELMALCEDTAKKINLNIVRLKFSAHHYDTDELLCPPVFSSPIHNLKSAQTNELKINRIDKTSGSVQGNEEVFILVEKVNRKNIQVRFIEINEETQEEVWDCNGHFTQADVHHQFAIVFRTPPYRDLKTTNKVKVYIELVRPSDGRTSERMTFWYKPDRLQVAKKRKADRSISSFSSIECSSGSLKSGEIPVTVNSPKHHVYKKSPSSSSGVSSSPAVMLPFPSEYLQPPSSNITDESMLAAGLYQQYAIGDLNVFPSPQSSTDVPIGYTGSFSLSTEFNKSDIIDKALAECARSGDFKFCMETLFDAADSPYKHIPETQMDNMFQDTNMSGLSSIFQNFNPTALKTDAAKKISDPVKKEIVIKKEPYVAYFKEKDGEEVKRDEDETELDDRICGRMHQLVSEIVKKNKTSTKSWIADRLKELMDLKMTNGDTFLHMTLCQNTSVQMTEYLVNLMHKVGVDKALVNMQNYQGETLLHLAIKHDLPRHVKFFVANGCDPMVEDKDGNNAFHIAVKYSTKYIISECFKNLLDASKEAERTGILTFNLDAYNKEKETVVHLAARNGYTACLNELLASGANPRSRDSAGRLPLHLAVYGDHLVASKILVENTNKVDVDCEDNCGNTPLQIVCSGSLRDNTKAIASLLLEKGANPTKKTRRNECPVRLAYRHPQMLALLQKYMGSEYIEIKSEPESESEDESNGSEDEKNDSYSYVPKIVKLIDRKD